MTGHSAADSTASPQPSHTVIYVRSLALSNFRNYAHLRLELEDKPVVLTGCNGVGKTNLLEVVSLLAPGRGLRRAKIAEIDRQIPLEGGVPRCPLPVASHSGNGEQGTGNASSLTWTIAATVRTPLGEVSIGTGRDPAAEENDKRLVKIDGRQVRSHTELATYVSVIWLTPQMDQLFLEGQSVRRRFLDRLVYGFDSEHASRVNAYEYAMRERNRLLATGRADASWLSSLEHEMAEASVAIAAARLETSAHLNQAMQQPRSSFPRASLSLSGMAEDLLQAGGSALEAETAMAEAFMKGRREDAASGRTGSGAHRSELTVMHVEKGMEAAFCSTGEQKALLLAMVLAEARAGALWHGRVPLLLLDEVVAHLDSTKRIELYEEICHLGAQAWLTGTDADLFHGMRDRACFFRVEQGMVFPCHPRA